MASSSPTLILPVLLALVLGVTAWHLWPGGSALWRRVAAVALGAGLGFQMAAAIRAAAEGRAAMSKAWLDCLAFPLAMGAFYYLPAAHGWMLLLGSWVWRFLVRNLWK